MLTFGLSCGTQGTWKCKGTESNTVFDSVEFEDGEWMDYDEKVRSPLSSASEFWWLIVVLLDGVGRTGSQHYGARTSLAARLMLECNSLHPLSWSA